MFLTLYDENLDELNKFIVFNHKNIMSFTEAISIFDNLFNKKTCVDDYLKFECVILNFFIKNIKKFDVFVALKEKFKNIPIIVDFIEQCKEDKHNYILEIYNMIINFSKQIDNKIKLLFYIFINDVVAYGM